MEALKTKEIVIPPEKTFGKPLKSVSGEEIFYPESDGKPMADNTKQYRWIVKIKEGLESLFADNPDVFVAADLFWYPVKGSNKIRTAPDVMAAFGRPKGDRGSYIQWKENNIAPRAVFEILSPGNRPGEMRKKFGFYERYGVEEYYIYDPDRAVLKVWVRSGNRLSPVKNTQGWVSPGLKIRFEITDCELVITSPDGQKFLSPLEAEQRAIMTVKAERERAIKAEKTAETERKRAVKAEKTVEAERKKARILADKLRELGICPESL
ncbi:Uma2 family endonuclease [Desulfococcaceae bacterium HSG8]|nr:Uma2 family endonuclease [Desulfococcaceae bacterium HSG8]